MDDIINSKIEGDNECKIYRGQEIKFTYSRSLWARLIQATDITKKNYKEIREYIASFDKVKIRESWNYISVVQSKRTLIKMNLTKNDVLVYFALTPAQIAKINYDYEDVSNVKAFESTPVKFRINENPDSIKKAIKLVNVVMSRFKISKTDKLVECNIPEYESHEDLIKDGKIKVYVKNLDTNTIYSDSESLNIYYEVKSEEEKTQQEILEQQEQSTQEELSQQNSNSELAQEQNVQDTNNNIIDDNTANEENVDDNTTYSNDIEEDEDSLKFQNNYQDDNEVFDDEEEDEEQYLNATETEPVIENSTTEEEPSTQNNVENEADSNRLEIEEKVQELLSEKSTSNDGLPSNAYKYINSIISVNFEQVIKEIQSLKEEIQNIKVTNTTIIQPTQTQYIQPNENISNTETETTNTSYKQEETKQLDNRSITEETITTKEPSTKSDLTQTTTIEDENNQVDNIPNTYQDTYQENYSNIDNTSENVISSSENVEVSEHNKDNEKPKTTKKKNIIAKMNDYELPKSAFYITFGVLAFVFILTCIIINLIV